MLKLIESYINVLSLDQMNAFLKQNNILLNKLESIYLLDYIKLNWYQIIYNPDTHLDIIKENINLDSYNKLYNLYIIYKERYLNYL